MLKVNSVSQVGKFINLEKIPDDLPQFAFIGRSNVGKSSLINFLLGRKKLAEISKKPGKTRSIDFFLVELENDEENLKKNLYFVDLPGYGYAKTSKVQRKDWLKLVFEYFINFENLKTVFLLIDSSIPPQKKDLLFAYELSYQKIPFSIIFTKIDKITKVKYKKNIENFCNSLKAEIGFVPQIFESSVVKKKGKEDILRFILGQCL